MRRTEAFKLGFPLLSNNIFYEDGLDHFVRFDRRTPRLSG